MASLIGPSRDAPSDIALAALPVAALVAVAVVRITLFGWEALSPDDARYLNVGLSVLQGRGPVGPGGEPYLARSPAYGVVLALGAQLGGPDALMGARLVAAALSLAGLLLAVRLAWLIGHAPGALGTAACLVALPLVWQLMPSLRIDLVQSAGICAALVLAASPTIRRWTAAGAVLGLAILVKETATPVIALPLAMLGHGRWTVWVRQAAGFWLAVIAVAGWWWLFVWIEAGVIFPANAATIVARREVDPGGPVTPGTAILVAVATACWIAFLRDRPRGLPDRLIAVAALGLLPAAVYAYAHHLGARNYAALAVLSAIAAGSVLGRAAPTAIARIRGSEAGRRPAAIGLVALTVVVGVLIFAGQHGAGRPTDSVLADRIAAVLASRARTGDRAVMSFRLREVTVLRLQGRIAVAGLPVERVGGTEDPSEFLWLGLRDQQLFGVRRESWRLALGSTPTRFLVLVTPHPLTPEALVEPLIRTGPRFGIALEETLTERRDRAFVFGVDGSSPEVGADTIGLHASGRALLRWLDLAVAAGSSESAATARLRAVGAIAVEPGLADYLTRISAPVR